jgi:hypothetical protein
VLDVPQVQPLLHRPEEAVRHRRGRQAVAGMQRIEWRGPAAPHPAHAALVRLQGGSQLSRVPASRMLVSYVLRHAASGMSVRTSAGQACRLEPGAMLLCSGPELMLEREAPHAGGCEAVDLMLPRSRNPGVFVHLGDYFPTFLNSAHGCVRLLMGSCDGHRGILAPLDGFWLLDIDVAPGQELDLPVAARGAVGLLTSGTLVVDGDTLEGTAPFVPTRCGDAVHLASASGASVLLFPQGFL